MAVAYREVAPQLPSNPPRISPSSNQSNNQINPPSQSNNQLRQSVSRLPSPPPQPTIVQLPPNQSASHYSSQSSGQSGHRHRSSHSQHHSHRSHRSNSQPSSSQSIQDEQNLALARAIQRADEDAESERAIRLALTRQFAMITSNNRNNQSIDSVDLSQLTLAEAQQAVEIALRVREKKRRGLIGRLKDRLSKKNQHLSVNQPNNQSNNSRSSNGRSSPSPSSPFDQPNAQSLNNFDVDVDNMSYDQLLALSEMIGDVKSKGLSEEQIDRLPIVIFQPSNQSSNQANNASNSQSSSQSIDHISKQSHNNQSDNQSADHFNDDSDDDLKSHETINPTLHNQSINEPINLAIYEPKIKKKKGFFSRLKKSKSTPISQSNEQAQSHAHPDNQSNAQSNNQSANVSRLTRQDSMSNNQSNNQCSICLEPYVVGDSLKFLPCLHRAHCHEMDQWLAINATCPVCKEKVLV